ncbi:hypothetical protein GCM10009087_31110 [Sphingomonas oligophenolica]
MTRYEASESNADMRPEYERAARGVTPVVRLVRPGSAQFQIERDLLADHKTYLHCPPRSWDAG